MTVSTWSSRIACRFAVFSGALGAVAMVAVLCAQSASAEATTTDAEAEVVAAVEASEPTQLNTPPGDGPVFDYEVTPDSTNAVYTSDPDSDGDRDLFKEAIDGGVPTQLDTGSGVGNVEEFAAAPNGEDVVYRTNGAAPGDLFSVPLEAGNPVQLDVGAGAGDVRDFKVSPDSAYTVYRSGPDPAQIGLFSVMTKGGAPTKLNTGFVTTDLEYQITPDGAYVVYQQRDVLDLDLFSVPIAGGIGPTQLNVAPGDQNVFQFHTSPNSEWVAYRSEVTTGFGNLFTVPTTGGLPVQLNTGVAAGSIALFRFSANSQTVVHGVHGHDPSTFDIYSVPVTGGTHIQLNVGDGGADPWWFFNSPTEELTVYTAEKGNHDFDLFTVPLSGGPAVKLNVGPGAGNVFATSVRFTPDGSTVLYRVERSTGRYDLFAVPTLGGTPVKMNAGLSAGVQPDFRSSPNGQYAAFRVLGADSLYLYATPIAGGIPTRLNALGQWIESFVISPDSSHVLYKTVGPDSDLFSVRVEVSETSVASTTATTTATTATTTIAAVGLPFTGAQPLELIVLAFLLVATGIGLVTIAGRNPRLRGPSG